MQIRVYYNLRTDTWTRVNVNAASFSVSSHPYPQHPHRTGQTLHTHMILWAVCCWPHPLTIKQSLQARCLHVVHQQCQRAEDIKLAIIQKYKKLWKKWMSSVHINNNADCFS